MNPGASSKPNDGSVGRCRSVSLVGAGPGDPGLRTIKAIKTIKAMRRATVLLVGEPVGEGVLRYARRSARRQWFSRAWLMVYLGISIVTS